MYFFAGGYQQVGLCAGDNSRSSFIRGDKEGLEGQGFDGCGCLEVMAPWSHLTFVS